MSGFYENPTDIGLAREHYAAQMKEDPKLRMFRVTLHSHPGVTFDSILLAKSKKESIEMALETVSGLRENDFYKKSEMVP